MEAFLAIIAPWLLLLMITRGKKPADNLPIELMDGEK